LKNLFKDLQIECHFGFFAEFWDSCAEAAMPDEAKLRIQQQFRRQASQNAMRIANRPIPLDRDSHITVVFRCFNDLARSLKGNRQDLDC
jgi:hypothetical protein